MKAYRVPQPPGFADLAVPPATGDAVAWGDIFTPAPPLKPASSNHNKRRRPRIKPPPGSQWARVNPPRDQPSPRYDI